MTAFAMLWDVASEGHGFSGSVATFEPSFEHYTQSAVGLSVWEVVQIALAAMAFTCFVLGYMVGCCVTKLFGTIGTSRAIANTSIPPEPTIIRETASAPTVVQGTAIPSHVAEAETPQS